MDALPPKHHKVLKRNPDNLLSRSPENLSTFAEIFLPVDNLHFSWQTKTLNINYLLSNIFRIRIYNIYQKLGFYTSYKFYLSKYDFK
jgi:hypothetical protein